MAIQVSHGAKSCRRPEPRFDPRDFHLRTTYGLFHDAFGRGSLENLRAGPAVQLFSEEPRPRSGRAHHDLQVRKRK